MAPPYTVRRDDELVDMEEVERLCDRVIILKRGQLVADGSPVALCRRFARDTLEDVFLDVARGRVEFGKTAEAAM